MSKTQQTSILPLYIKPKEHRPSFYDYIKSFSNMKDNRKYYNEDLKKKYEKSKKLYEESKKLYEESKDNLSLMRL
mgnify:CR=1 FL=1